MGIDIHTLKFVKHAQAQMPLMSTVTIGRQELHVLDFEVREIVGADQHYQNEKYCEHLLQEYLGATSVESIDNSSYEGATHVHDMNRPLPENLKHRYDTVIDGGTLEHVFNVPQALKNCSDLCKVGGQILHIVPANNFCGHGFWQFSPELFFSLYSDANGYGETEVLVADLANKNQWYRVHPPSQGLRVNISSSTPLYLLVRTVLKRADFTHETVQQSDYLVAWEQGEPVPATKEAMLPNLRKRLKTSALAYRMLFPVYDLLLRPKTETRLHPNNPNLTVVELQH